MSGFPGAWPLGAGDPAVLSSAAGKLHGTVLRTVDEEAGEEPRRLVVRLERDHPEGPEHVVAARDVRLRMPTSTRATVHAAGHKCDDSTFTGTERGWWRQVRRTQRRRKAWKRRQRREDCRRQAREQEPGEEQDGDQEQEQCGEGGHLPRLGAAAMSTEWARWWPPANSSDAQPPAAALVTVGGINGGFSGPAGIYDRMSAVFSGASAAGAGADAVGVLDGGGSGASGESSGERAGPRAGSATEEWRMAVLQLDTGWQCAARGRGEDGRGARGRGLGWVWRVA